MATLNSCRNELRSIINELKDIENGIRQNAVGLGENRCADALNGVINKYEYVLRKLNNVDTNRLADWINGEE